MGTSSSTTRQKLGERVLDARSKLAAAKKLQEIRLQQLQQSKETLDAVVQSIADSFLRCAPFSESALVVAFAANPEEVQRIVTKACKQVLSAPIRSTEYAWFKRHVFPSMVWMMRNERDELLFEHLLTITKSMSQKVDNSMHAIFAHLEQHKQWHKVLAIENLTVVARQDDDRVGLLKQQGIRNVLNVVADEKQQGADEDEQDEQAPEQDVTTFIDSHLAVNMLTTTAKKINAEFQSRMGGVMSRYGDYKEGPIKTGERCQSKLENEYQEAEYPKAAKLLDVIRCSVSFNTVEQLLAGYEGIRNFIDTTPDSLELARVKNGFLEKGASYRDIKVNVVYHSETDPDNPVSMICEVQLILNQYLHEKKRIHKKYDILRERTFFEIVAKGQHENGGEANQTKDLKKLQFEPVLKVNTDVKLGLCRRLLEVFSRL